MSDNFKTFLTFVLGAAAGSAATWYFLSKKHEREIEDLNDQWSEYCDSLEEIEEKENEQNEPEEIPTRVAEPRHYTTTNIQDYAASTLPQSDTNNEEGDESMDEPVVITPEEFSDLEYEGYSTETLTYYACGTLTDFLDEVIENVDDMIGADSLNHFGEYEEDTVFVRNDHLMTGYEIQRDLRTYAEVVGE